MNNLVSAVGHRRDLPQAQRKMPLAERAARQHAEGMPSILNRVTGNQGTVPSASAFQSAL